MDILLTHGYFLSEDAHEREIMRPYPPLGLLYLASHLEAQGVEVEVFDSTFGSPEELFARVESDRPPVVGIYGNLMTRPRVVEIAQGCHDRGAITVLGGPEPANYAEEYLDRGTDVIVRGEGELTLEHLLGQLLAHGLRDLHEIPGIVYRNGEGVAETAPRELIADLNGQPLPARHKIDIARYVETWRRHHGRGSVSLITARGCPYRCSWCSHGVYGFTHRRRSADNVADEVEAIVGAYQPDQLWYADDVFTIHHRWLGDYAKALADRGLRLPFETITREDRLDEDVIGLLAEMGCERLWIGAESGSQRVLESMSRQTNADRTREMIELVQKHGIEAGTFIMVGYEGETQRDLEDTVSHLKAALPDQFTTTISYPIRGTAYHEQVRDRIVEPEDWAKSSDRDLKIKGRPSRRYHEHAIRWMTHEVNGERHRRRGMPGLPGRLRAGMGSLRGRFGMWRHRHGREA